jgi:hypothetical protein
MDRWIDELGRYTEIFLHNTEILWIYRNISAKVVVYGTRQNIFRLIIVMATMGVI